MVIDVITHARPLPKLAVGIDLGTTHSLVAVARTPLQADVLAVDEGLMLPSVVSYSHTETYVGAAAQSQPDFIQSFKRFMPTPAQALYKGANATQLSAVILAHLREKAEHTLGEPVKHAVITVPAYFDDTARQATKNAAYLAGLTVLRLINEPTAAALAYGLHHQAKGTYVIYDLGGGTFDVSILKLTDGFFQVLSTAGDIALGGDDIDTAILAHWGAPESHRFLARQAKEHLATKAAWCHSCYPYTLNAKELTALAQPWVEKTIAICAQALGDASVSIADIDAVVLVGGSTRLSTVRHAVEGFFKQAPLTTLNPDTVVAKGAALHAYALTHGSTHLLVDVCPLSLGIETMGGMTEKIIPRNTPIPTAMAQDFTTYESGQTAMSFHVVQGEREFANDCRSLAHFTLEGIPPLVAGAARVRVTFALDADGILTVGAQEQTTRVNQTVHINPTYGIGEDAIKTMIMEGFEHGREDMANRLLRDTLLEAEQMIYFVNHALTEDGDLLSVDEKKLLHDAIKDLESSLTHTDRSLINEKTTHLAKLSQPFAEKRIEKAIQQKMCGKPLS
jgi:molecular chaperone HscA